MAPHIKSRSIKGTIISTLVIMIATVICSVSVVAGIDIACRNDINHWLPVYPNSEQVVVQQSGFFRIRASGITQIIYHSTDDPATVRNWYSAYRREITRSAYNSDNPNAALKGMADTSYQIIDDPDGVGSRIIQRSECAYN